MTTPTRRAAAGGPAASVAQSVALLALGRGVANASLRWIPLFLPTIARALDTTLGRCAAIIGAGELVGICGPYIGRLVERHGAKRWLLAGLAVVAAANLISTLSATTAGFAAGYSVLVLGQSFAFISGQAWIGRHVPFERRGRYLGAYEASWALSLLLGAPLAAAAVAWSWRGPFLLWAALAVIAMAPVARLLPADTPSRAPTTRRDQVPMPAAAWAAVAIAFLLMFCALTVVVVSGAWLEDRYGFGARALAGVAFLSGGAELVATVAVAKVNDRWGARRSLATGVALVVAAALLIAGAGDQAMLAVAGFTLFIASFEFAFVATLTLAVRHEAAVIARLVGAIGAGGTVARAIAATLAAGIYAAGGNVAIGLVAAAVAAAVFAVLPLATTEPTTPRP